MKSEAQFYFSPCKRSSLIWGFGLFLVSVVFAESVRRDSKKPSDIMFFGDSMTKRADWNNLLDLDVINAGLDGQCISDMCARLHEVDLTKPRFVFVMAGINDLLRGSTAEKAFIRYRELIEDMKSKEIELLIQSTLFLGSEHPLASVVNEEVILLNAKLREYCDVHGLTFIDVSAALELGAGGSSLYRGDNLHLTTVGYQAWRQVLIPVLENLKCSRTRPVD